MSGIDLDEIEMDIGYLEALRAEAVSQASSRNTSAGDAVLNYLTELNRFDTTLLKTGRSLLAEVRRLRAAVQDRDEQIERLVSALERTQNNFELAVRNKPVRDMCENLAENRAALAGSDD